MIVRDLAAEGKERIVRNMLILASASPRRSELLRQINMEFACRPAECEELTSEQESDPVQLVLKNAALKARAAAVFAEPGDAVLGADTVVSCQGRIFGKPHSDEEASKMLWALSGRVHQVCTGIAVIKDGRLHSDVSVTDVAMKELSIKEIADYVKSGEPHGKAGAYAIQGLAAVFVEKINGSYSNVVGLPLNCLYSLLQKTGIEP